MKKAPVAFVCAQVLDAITTMAGLHMGLREMNPLANSNGSPDMATMYAVKAVVTACVGGVLFLKRKGWLDWLVVAVSALPVVWNVFNIVMELV